MSTLEITSLFFQRLETLPFEVQEYFGASVSKNQIDLVAKKYGLRSDYLHDLVTEIIAQQVRLEDLTLRIDAETRRGRDVARNIAKDFVGYVFLPLDEFLPEYHIAGALRALGGDSQDYASSLEAFQDFLDKENTKTMEEGLRLHEQYFDANDELAACQDLFKNNVFEIFRSTYDDNKRELNASLIALLHLGPQYKEKLLLALYQNKEKLTDSPFKLKGALAEPTVENWLKDFLSREGSGIFEKLAMFNYVTQSENGKVLNTTERNHVIQLLSLYRNLKFFPQSMEGLPPEQWEIVPIGPDEEVLGRVGKAKEAMTRRESDTFSQTNTKSVANEISFQYRGDEELLQKYQDELKSLDTSFRGDTMKLRSELFLAVRNKNAYRFIAILQRLIEKGDIPLFLKQDEKLNAFLKKVWQEKYGDELAQEFIKHSDRPKFFRLFIEYVLQDRLELREGDAARFGIVLGNIFRQAGQADFSRLAYYDMEHQAFRWFR